MTAALVTGRIAGHQMNSFFSVSCSLSPFKRHIQVLEDKKKWGKISCYIRSPLVGTDLICGNLCQWNKKFI